VTTRGIINAQHGYQRHGIAPLTSYCAATRAQRNINNGDAGAAISSVINSITNNRIIAALYL